MWALATIRTAGEEFAMARGILAVLSPRWMTAATASAGSTFLRSLLLNPAHCTWTLRVSGLSAIMFPELAQLSSGDWPSLAERPESGCD